jgi:ATP-dependent Clp protease adaptor protein ClpS
MSSVETKLENSINTKDEYQNHIVLFNDEHNDFNFVIACLVKYCKHNPHQAEQCALITHHNGKCSVKKGPVDDLISINQALIDSGLSSEIQ